MIRNSPQAGGRATPHWLAPLVLLCALTPLACTALAPGTPPMGEGSTASSTSGSTATEGRGYPMVRFNYGFPFDRTCSRLTKTEIPEQQIDELYAKFEQFQAYWDEHGPALLAAAVATTGLPFVQRELRATVSLCQAPSMSHPLIINLRHFLDNGQESPPREMFRFSALVFHELLHIYIVDHMRSSALREKYSDEAPSVKNHLHLMALMKSVYLQLGRKEELLALIAASQAPGREIYARSWEIVNEVEGYEPFIEELRQQVR